MYVVNKKGPYWKSLLSWAQEKRLLTPKEISMLTTASLMPRKLPSLAQCKKIIDIEDKMEDEGFIVNST